MNTTRMSEPSLSRNQRACASIGEAIGDKSDDSAGR